MQRSVELPDATVRSISVLGNLSRRSYGLERVYFTVLGTSSLVRFHSADICDYVEGDVLYLPQDHWTSTALADEAWSVAFRQVARTGPTDVQSSAELVQTLHDESALTWDQLAKLFGVSRRAVHQWVAGGRMNAANAERLAYLLRVVRDLPGSDPDARRSALFAPNMTGGRSRFDALRAENASRPDDINASAGAFEKRVDSLPDRR